MPKASRKELRKSLFKKGCSIARDEAKKESKAKHEAIGAAKPPVKSTQKRFILFVGNLPYDVTEQQIKDHFKNCGMSSLRMRSNGICFLEFSGADASQNLHHALQFHHTNLGKRRINVELSAGGGGNSQNRREKIRQKNESLQEELKERQRAEKREIPVNTSSRPAKHQKVEKKVITVSPEESAKTKINPARLAALRKK